MGVTPISNVTNVARMLHKINQGGLNYANSSK